MTTHSADSVYVKLFGVVLKCYIFSLYSVGDAKIPKRIFCIILDTHVVPAIFELVNM